MPTEMEATATIDWGKHYNRLAEPLDSSGTHLGTRGIKWERFAFRRDARCNSWMGANMWSHTSSSVYPTSSVWPGRTPCMIFAAQSSGGSEPAQRFVGNGIFEERCVCTTRKTDFWAPEAEPEATPRTRNTRRTRHMQSKGTVRGNTKHT